MNEFCCVNGPENGEICRAGGVELNLNTQTCGVTSRTCRVVVKSDVKLLQMTTESAGEVLGSDKNSQGRLWCLVGRF